MCFFFSPDEYQTLIDTCRSEGDMSLITSQVKISAMLLYYSQNTIVKFSSFNYWM